MIDIDETYDHEWFLDVVNRTPDSVGMVVLDEYSSFHNPAELGTIKGMEQVHVQDLSRNIKPCHECFPNMRVKRDCEDAHNIVKASMP